MIIVWDCTTFVITCNFHRIHIYGLHYLFALTNCSEGNPVKTFATSSIILRFSIYTQFIILPSCCWCFKIPFLDGKYFNNNLTQAVNSKTFHSCVTNIVWRDWNWVRAPAHEEFKILKGVHNWVRNMLFASPSCSRESM